MKRFTAVLCLISLILSLCCCTQSGTTSNNKPACAEHSYGEWTVTVKSPDGMIFNEERVCSICEDTEVRTVNLLDTVPEEWIAVFDEITVNGDNPVADIYYMEYATTEDRAARNGTPVLYKGKVTSDDRSYWSKYDTIPDLVKTLFTDYVISEVPVAEVLVKSYIGVEEVNPRQLTALEEKYGKSALTEIYLNTLRFSDKIYGINAACNGFLTKNLSELDIADVAMLCAIANTGDPRTELEPVKAEYESILASLKDKGSITEEDHNSYLTREFSFAEDYVPNYDWYTEIVITDTVKLLSEKLGIDTRAAESMLYSDDLKIYTVVDPDIQTLLESFFIDDSKFMRISGGVQPQCAMVITDPATADVLAIVGSRGEKTSNDAPNYADELTRSPGSSIKPVAVYGPCLENKLIHYSTLVDDNYYTMLGDRKWPSNWPVGYRGLTPVYDGVRRSVNTIAVRLLMQLTPQTSYEYTHDKLGMHSVVGEETTAAGYIVNDKNASALALGGMLHGLTVRELIGAYQIFNNGGVFTGNRTVLKIEDRYGNVIVDNEGTPSQVMSPGNASIMTKMLQNVVDSGTADCITLDDRVECAGKTGTTSYDKDRWFMGYTPYYMGGVWFGYENSASLAGFSEIKSPAVDVWDKFMTELHEQEVFSQTDTPKDFELHESVTVQSICSGSGKLAGANCGSRITNGYYTEDNMPTEYCNWH
ncbi:MAG: transglycosylase domain-containing protein [Clostridia bacterium]|nr:transglycosylase domain-containing protein [Clostridia bacterium]